MRPRPGRPAPRGGSPAAMAARTTVFVSLVAMSPLVSGASPPVVAGASPPTTVTAPPQWRHAWSVRGGGSGLRARVVSSDGPFREAGRAEYPARQLDMPVTWNDVARMGNKVGRVCEEDEDSCGEELVCRQGICRHCLNDEDCPGDLICKYPFRGASMCTHPAQAVWLRFFTEPGEFFCTVLIFLSSVLAAAAGVGGGGMFVPLLLRQRQALEVVACS